jgi:hypothetical protein
LGTGRIPGHTAPLSGNSIRETIMVDEVIFGIFKKRLDDFDLFISLITDTDKKSGTDPITTKR